MESKGISRRGFLQGASAAGLAVAGSGAILTLLEGCGGDSGGLPPTFVIPTPGQRTFIVGQVTDTSGTPQGGASVSISGGGATTTTSQGLFGLAVSNAGGTFTVTAGKSGFVSRSAVVFVHPNEAEATTLVLTALPAAVAASGTINSPANQSNAGLANPGQVVFPTAATGITVSVVASPPVAQGEAGPPSSSGSTTEPAPIPLSTAVNVQLNGGTSVPADAVVNIPTAFPGLNGQSVSVEVTDANGNVVTLPGVSTVSNDNVAVTLQSIINALTASRSRQAGGSLFFQVRVKRDTLTISITVTINEDVHSEQTHDIDLCGSDSPQTLSFTENANETFGVTVNGVPAPAAFVYFIALLFGIPDLPTVSITLTVPAQSHIRVVPIERKIHITISVGIAVGTIVLAMSADLRFSLWSALVGFIPCSGTGATGTR